MGPKKPCCLLDADPAAAVVHYELARLERSEEQWSAARSAIDQAVTLDPENAWYQKELADIALELENRNGRPGLDSLLENKPEDDLSANHLTRIAQGDIKGALNVVDVLEREWGPDRNGISSVTVCTCPRATSPLPWMPWCAWKSTSPMS